MKRRLVLLLLLGFGIGPAWSEVRTDAGAEMPTAVTAVAPAEVPTKQAVTPAEATTSAVSELRLKTEPVRSESGGMGAASVQMVLGLAAVLALIFAMAWLAKRFNLNGAGGMAGMRMLGAMSVGPKEKIVLVEVEGKRLLLGVTTQQIVLLQTLEPGTAPVENADFAGKIQALLKTGTLNEK